ncbi:MAG TPA: [protein-PII] uridylyltransferase [Thermohalobaculum sp.]|nr:[protein-PII] uridylyltransferase [Thermohalobaculum sp.]
MVSKFSTRRPLGSISVREGGLIAKIQVKRRSSAERTFAGLANLVAPAADLADLGRLTEAIDAVISEAAKAGSDSQHRDVAELIGKVLAEGRDKVRVALLEHPHAGLRVARSYTHVIDVVIAGVFHYCATHLHPAPIRTNAQQLAVVAVGGTGRGEMAPFSDVDLLFLTPYKQTAWGESVIESMLYILWDLKLKVGQAVRSINECFRLAGADLTIRTALLEKRFICGDRPPFDELETLLWNRLFLKTGHEFVEAKLGERDQRHAHHGGSRYMLEPNIKEGKGGLRDLQSLHWISKYLYRTDSAWDLVEMGVFERDEVQHFAEASKFIWAVRCHLHDLAGRAQEQLTFDRQVEIAGRMGFTNHDGRMAVEHFMQVYFRHAKNVGDLTRIFSAALEAKHAKAPPRLSTLLRALSFRSVANDPKQPFIVRDGRLSVRDDLVFATDPVNLLRLFRDAARLDAHIHPAALRLVTRNLDLIDDDLRANPDAIALFLEMLTDATNGEWLLRLMNETAVLGRFVPEFGRVVAMMQFNMYHHYTVDEHTIQTIATLNRIERLEAAEEHPVATEIVEGGFNRRVLYMALFVHDLGKGDPRDHSEYGAEIAASVCPRLGFDRAETEMVAWLVRHHLLMSDVAQKRDTSDPRTVKDFAEIVQSPTRLRLLLVMTVCDIRGVGPGVWNNWKAQLLRRLYWDTRDFLTGGSDEISRATRVAEAQAALTERLADWPEADRASELGRHYPPYWLGLDTDTHATLAELALKARSTDRFSSHFQPDESHDATKACLYMEDHPGIFSRMAGAFALAGASVVDARTYTTSDGMACSTFWIQDRDGHPFEENRLPRLKRTIERILKGEVSARDALRERRREKAREMPFTVPTRIVFENEGSDLYTVIEVNARDRLGLLHLLTRTLTDLNINIFSAVIATYGEHAVDVFYVKDLFGHKIRSAQKQANIERRLIEAVEGIAPETTKSDKAALK